MPMGIQSKCTAWEFDPPLTRSHCEAFHRGRVLLDCDGHGGPGDTPSLGGEAPDFGVSREEKRPSRTNAGPSVSSGREKRQRNEECQGRKAFPCEGFSPGGGQGWGLSEQKRRFSEERSLLVGGPSAFLADRNAFLGRSAHPWRFPRKRRGYGETPCKE
jgi:hypothetical protein